MVTRVLRFAAAPVKTGAVWSIEWTRRQDGFRNGVWLNLGEHLRRSEVLELRPSGVPHTPGTAPLFALWQARPVDTRRKKLDLKGLVARDAPGPEWGAFEAAPGIYYGGTEPGLFRVDVPPGGVALTIAKNAGGGPVEIRYADDTRVLDTFAPAVTGEDVVLARRRLTARRPLRIEQPLPHYPLSALTLAWHDSLHGRLVLSDAAVDTRLLGVTVYSQTVLPRLVVGGRQRPGSARGLRLSMAASGGRVEFDGSRTRGLWPSGLGIPLLALALLGIMAAASPAARGIRWVGARVPFEAVAVVLVVAAPLWMAAWAPVLYYPDSLEYLTAAFTLLDTHGFADVHPSRVPGYTVLLAALLRWCPNVSAALGAVQAVLGVAIALLTFDTLRPFAPRPWPAVAMLLVGLSPVILGYERTALSEIPATFCASLIAWAVVRLVSAPRGTPAARAAGIVGAAALGLLCAAGAYVRSNFQLLVALVPAIVVVAEWGPRARAAAVARAATVALVGALCLLPWILGNAKTYGRAAFVIGQNYARLVEGYSNDLVDENQVAVFGFEQWRSIRLRRAPEAPYFDSLTFLQALHESRLAPPAGLPNVIARETVAGPVIDESLARRPGLAFGKRLRAFASQMGLWDKEPSFNRGAGNIFLLSPLRGTQLAYDTNLLLAGDPPKEPRLHSFLDRVRESALPLRQSASAAWYNELFWMERFLGPLVGVLFLLGLAFAIRDRVWLLAGLGGLVVANAAALAVLVFSDYDRYSVPFRGLTAILVAYGLHRLLAVRRARRAPVAPTPTG